MGLRGNLYIPSIDAKDLYISNNYIKKSPYGYKLPNKETDNLTKYKNSFDYSLDLIELREVAKKVYSKRESLSFIKKNKEYSSKVINVTFKYSVKEFNRINSNTYVRFGYNYSKLNMENGYAFVEEDGVKTLVAIQTDMPVYNKIPEDVILPSCFVETYNEKTLEYVYIQSGSIKTVMSSKELRKWIYNEGFICNGIKYCRFKRSSGSARVGKCLFIDARLYPDMHKSEQCGLDIQIGDPLDIAAFEAYISLPTSSIVDTIDIAPENILVVDDWESVFEDDAICTDLTEDNWLYTFETKMKVCNSIWDGQSLIDISLMGKYEDKGMLLLRNKFFKSCCFNTNIQQFFKDNNITELSQLNGTTIATKIEDIKLITTPSSIKFFKFGDYQTWCDNIYPFFGVVKYDKNTHYFDGRMVQTHYQLLNTLQLSLDEVNDIVKDGLNYISLINTDIDIMRYHLKFKKNNMFNTTDNVMKDKNEIVYKMLNFDCDFDKTDLYYTFKKTLCRSYIKNMKVGHILIDGTYATLFGNPYEMLLQSINKFTGKSTLLPGEVHNIRYDYGEELICSRSPHVTIGNILLAKNTECEIIDKYFNLTNNIICINSINDNILERLSGADFDSDSMIISNNKTLVNAAKKNYDIFKVPTRNINPPKSKRHYTYDELADLDTKTSVNKIGEIVNRSQELNSLIWHMIHNQGGDIASQYESIKEIYYDVCQLDVMSNIEIDKAKKEFSVDMKKELDKISFKYKDILTSDDGRKKMPGFLGYIAELKDYRNDEKKNYEHYDTAMDYLHKALDGFRSKKSKTNKKISLYDIFKPSDYNKDKVNKKQVNKILELAKKKIDYNNALSMNKSLNREEKTMYRELAKEDFIYEINNMKINEHTMYRILKKTESYKNMRIRNYIFYILFNYKNNTLTNIINSYDKFKNIIEEDDDGNIEIYGKNHKKVPLS